MKAFVVTTLVLLATAIASFVAYFAGAEADARMRAFAVGFLTLGGLGGSAYLVNYIIRMRQLDIPADELGDDEVVWARTTHARQMDRIVATQPMGFRQPHGGRDHAVGKRQLLIFVVKTSLKLARTIANCGSGGA